ncbi:MAG: hypothetical protein DRI48_04960 [Chloroflexi bacterium]|nr:MAG: hypothetical protein DRI48_04960 [Chloroflexota bacterium]
MTKKKRDPLTELAENLSRMMQGLPSITEREAVVRNIDTIIKYLQELRDRIGHLPTSEDGEKLLAASKVLVEFLESAKKNPALAIALGLKTKVPPKKKEAPISPQGGERLFREIQHLPTEQIQTKLLDYKEVTMDDLRALATHLGIKYEQRIKRQELVDRIVKIGFANVRGYKALRSEEESKKE